MRVGVDARLLSEQITGIGRYTFCLSNELVNQRGDYFLYCANQIDTKVSMNPGVTVRSAFFQSRLGRMLWSQTCLPSWAAKDDIDVFWGATHRLPLFLQESVARVVTIHDLVWKYASETMRPLSRIMEQMLMPRAIKMADRIVADSESTAMAIAREYPLAANKIRVVYPGTPCLPQPSDLSTIEYLDFSGDYFLFVGTLEPRKNLDRLLQAFASLSTELKQQYQLVIAGGKGWGDVNLDYLISQYNLEEYVHVIGYISDIELSTLYANANFLVMPSLYEGFGLPIVEAMSFGVPVLTSNTSSMPEVAGDAGILVDPLSINSIASGLTKLMDPIQRDLLASMAKKNSSRFTWEKAAVQLHAVLQEAIDERRNRL